MVFQLGFKGPHQNNMMRLVVCDFYGLLLHSSHFSA